MSLHMMFRVGFFSDFRYETVMSICERLDFLQFNQGDFIITEGETGDRMFIIVQGQCEVVKERLDSNSGQVV